MPPWYKHLRYTVVSRQPSKFSRSLRGYANKTPQGRPAVAKVTNKSNEPADKPDIHVTRNGEIYVTAKDVVNSKKFKDQVKKMASIPVTREPANSA